LASISRIKKYNRDNTIFYEGEQSHALIIVAEGTLKQAPFPASAYCETDVKIVCVDMNTFREIFLEDPKVSYRIIESLLEKIRIIETNIEINVASTAKDKMLYKSESGYRIVTEHR